MFETKLIQVLIRFSKEEQRKLRKWIVSDFVNKNEDITQLFKFIDTRTVINENTVHKQKVHEYLYPGVSFNDLRIRHLIWLSTDVLESFIVYNRLSDYPALQEKILAQYYTDKELYRFANQSIETGLALMEKSRLHNSDYYLSLFQLHANSFLINSRNTRDKELNLKDIIHAATVFSVIELLKYACIVQSFKGVSQIEIRNVLLESILQMLPDSGYLELPQVRIYYNIFQVITTENTDAFQDFIRDIKKNEGLFSKHDLNDLYRLGINFCIKKSNQNILEYTSQAFELYLYAVKKGYLIINHEISRFIFTNIITLGIKLKEFAKIDKFMKQYAVLIDAAYRQNTIDFNQAKILYGKQHHQQALKILLTNEFKDIIWNLNAKYLVLKILFEIGDTELCRVYLKSLKMYIKRKSNIGYHKTYFSNVCKAFTTLLDVQKKPAKYLHFSFDPQTPDIDFFNKALVRVKELPSIAAAGIKNNG